MLPDYLLPVVDADFSYSHLPAADSLRPARRVAMRAERAALAVLVHRADSLLLTLGEAAAPVVPAVPVIAVATADSVRPVAPFSRWSVLVAGAPERSFLGLQAPATDSVTALRRTHEQGRGGFNAAVLAEYRLTHRWSLAAGAGLSTTNSELRFTDRRTEVGVTYDTTVATTRKTDEVTARAYLIQYVPEPHPTPVFNLNGQVVGYDTVWINRADTTWTVYTATLVTQSTVKTVTPLISRHEVVNARILRPTYRFLTVPLLLRYRFGRLTDWASSATAPRWWADVAVGAQLQFFLGGSHLVTADGGRTYRTQRVGRHETAFRPMNVTLLGQVAANYALTSALSVSVAPTMRWQPQSVYRPSTGLQQKPTATGIQLGVRYSF